MEIRIYDTFEDETLKKRWKEIVDTNGYFVQNSYEWCSTWWKYFRNKNRKLYVITVLQDGDIVGIVPMFIESKFGFRQLRFVGTGLTDFHQFLIRKACYRAVVQAALKFLRRFSEWDLVYLDQINDEDSLYEHLDKIQNVHKKHRIGCPIIDIYDLGWDTYFNNVRSSNHRRDYKKKLRRLEKKVHPDFIEVNTEAGFREYIDDLLKLHAERWLYECENSKFNQRDLRAFIVEVFSSLFQQDKAVLFVLKDGENLISYRLGFIQQRVYYDWNTSFNLDYSQYSPGKIITGYILRDLIENSYNALHFMRGVYRFKMEWMHKDRDHISNNYLFICSNSSPRGRILERYYLYWRDDIKERFEKTISNRYFRSIFRLDRQ